MIRFFILIIVIALSLSLVMLRSLSIENDTQNSLNGTKPISIRGSNTVISGENQIEKQDHSESLIIGIVDYSQINNSAKIYDAYISDVTEESLQSFDYEKIADKNSVLGLSNTYYCKDKNYVYFCINNWSKLDGIKPDTIKGILPYKSYTGTSAFATDGKSIFFWGRIVENGEIQSLKFKVFGVNNIVGSDKNNLYIGNNIIQGKSINDLEMIDEECYKDTVSVICNFFEGGGTKFDIVKGADLGSFASIKSSFQWYKDKNYIYFLGYKKAELDINTFEILDDFGLYSKDKNGVYYFGERIEGINPNGFDLDKYLKEKQNPM